MIDFMTLVQFGIVCACSILGVIFLSGYSAGKKIVVVATCMSDGLGMPKKSALLIINTIRAERKNAFVRDGCLELGACIVLMLIVLERRKNLGDDADVYVTKDDRCAAKLAGFAAHLKRLGYHWNFPHDDLVRACDYLVPREDVLELMNAFTELTHSAVFEIVFNAAPNIEWKGADSSPTPTAKH